MQLLGLLPQPVSFRVCSIPWHAARAALCCDLTALAGRSEKV